MENYFTLILLLVVVLTSSCARMRKFDRVETTLANRYSIVYKNNRCVVYDIQADSPVTDAKYDALFSGRTASEQGIEVTILAPYQESGHDKQFGSISLSSYPTLEPDDILFAYCTGPGSQGVGVNYLITNTGAVYRVGAFEYGATEFMESVCPFLIDWDYDTMPDLELLLKPDSRFTFKRDDWCWLGLCGSNTLYIHASAAAEFANATKDYSSIEMYNKWLDVAVGLVEKMLEDKIKLKSR